MYTEREYPCPACGAQVWVPLDYDVIPGRRLKVRARIREREFTEAFTRHIMLNPELHPKFVSIAE